MRKATLMTVALTLVIGVVGCATLPFESKLEKPVSMTQVKDTPTKEFVSYSKALWLFWGLVELSLPAVDDVIVPEIADHTGVQNLKITTESSFIDVVVTALTDGIIIMRTVTIEGEIYD